MALHWNVKELDESWAWIGPEGEEKLNGRVECLIWATMFVGMDKISADNAADFFARLRLWEQVHGALCTNGELLTAEEVFKSIGLWTNASRLSEAKWRKQLIDGPLARAKVAFNEELVKGAKDDA